MKPHKPEEARRGIAVADGFYGPAGAHDERRDAARVPYFSPGARCTIKLLRHCTASTREAPEVIWAWNMPCAMAPSRAAGTPLPHTSPTMAANPPETGITS